MPVYTCPRCGGPITDVAGMLQCPTAPCQYGHKEPRSLVPQADPPGFATHAITKAGYEYLFDVFWDEYPRKTAKAVAKKSWMKLKPDPDLLRRMIATLTWQKQSKQWAEDGIIPHASTWLNQRRWEDEPPTTLIPAGPPKPPPMSFKEQDRHKAAALRRQAVRPGVPLPPRPNVPPRPTTQPLPLPAYTGPES